MMASGLFAFAPPRPTVPEPSSKPRIQVLVADDDADVHFVTKIALKEFDFEGRRLEILGSASLEETKLVLRENPGVAVVFLDVVMDVRDAGLQLVEWIRNVWGNKTIRIILRTGHPGDSPEYDIIRRYDINDYKVKTELTQQRLQFALYSALRSWQDLLRVDESRANLQTVLQVGAELFSARNLDEFLGSILAQVTSLHEKFRDPQVARPPTPDGFILSREDGGATIVSGSGRFADDVDKDFDRAPEFAFLRSQLEALPEGPPAALQVIDTGLLIFSRRNADRGDSFVYLETPPGDLNLDQVRLLMSHFSLALENFQRIQYVRGLQDDILFTISDVIERHFNETANHVRRVSTLVGEFARRLGWSADRAELLRVASIMHDIGKIGIPESILKKAGPLTPEERVVIQTHTLIGSEMLSRSHLPLFKVAARIARSHHENWNGTGYPDGLAGETIPLEARMMALVDVYDALRSARVYKPAWALDKVIAEMQSLVGKKFDPNLAPVFLAHIAEMDSQE